MFWNHRAMKRVEYGEENIYIVEVYYDEKTPSTVIGWTGKEVVYGESLEELHQTLLWMLEALEKPVLDEAELLSKSKDSFSPLEEDTITCDLEELIDELEETDPGIRDRVNAIKERLKEKLANE